MLSDPKPQPLWEAGGRKGLSTGQQVPSSLLHLPQERAGLGSHPRAMAGVGVGNLGSSRDHPPPIHTHTPWAAAAGELGWGRQDSSANRSRSRKLRATHPGGRRRAHPALPSPARGGLLRHFCRRAHSGEPQTCTPIAARVPQAGALLETMSTHFRLCTCSVLGTSL